MRLNVSVPAELVDQARASVPDLNMSRLLQQGLRELVRCDHHRLTCASCSAAVERIAIVDPALSSFYGDELWALEELVVRGGTAEGAARVIKDVALRHQISAAGRLPLPRPNRAERFAAKVKQFPYPGEDRTA